MRRFDVLAGSWPVLADRLDRSGALARWARREPALVGIGSMRELRALVGMHGANQARRDELLGALVRVAARDGGDDPDAVLVIVHLLRGGILTLARRFAHRGPDVLAVVIGELASQIRGFPWRTARAYPTRLLLDTKHALWRGELRPLTDGRRPYDPILIPPTEWPEHPAPTVEPDLDLADLLCWAAHRGVASVEELRLLLTIEQHRRYGTGSRQHLAELSGITERTLRRRRNRTLTKLRAAADDYLAAA